ncbi:MAG: secretin N-terminal domain-containing protein [Magnetococcales bacterium]|nr:secretin N-terminal domain-containing protein [Magnetococcales bacterium]
MNKKKPVQGSRWVHPSPAKQGGTQPLRPPLAMWVCGLMILGLSGCQSHPPPPAFPEQIESAKDLFQKQTQPAQATPSELQTAQPIPAKEADVEPEQVFDIQVSEAPVRSVLEGLVAGTPYSLVIDPKVEGNLSLNLKQVTVKETVNIICRMHNFDCQNLRRGFVILPKQMTTKTFRVHYPDMSRNGSSSLRVASGQTQGGSASSSSSSSSQTSAQQQSTVGTQLDTHFHSDFWQELTDVVCATLGLSQSGSGASSSGQSGGSGASSGQGSGSGSSPSASSSASSTTGGTGGSRLACSGTGGDGLERSIGVSRQTGLVTARALPSELQRLEKILGIMQSTLERQVVLEAKVVEVQLNSGSQSGINWASLVRLGSNKGMTIGQTGGGTLLNPLNRPSDLYSISGTLPIGQYPQGSVSATANGVLQVPYSAFGGVIGLGIQLHDFQGFLELLESQGKVHVLSSPRISTLNSQKAVIKVGTDDFYVTNVVQTAATTTSGSSTNFTISQFFSGVALDVVPRIGEDGTITMHIHPSIYRVTGKPTPLGGQTFSLASNSTRESDSVVRARNGEIVVIGGLMTEEFQQDHGQVPILGDLPLLGNLFKQARDQKTKTELVILIKPTLVESPTSSSVAVPPEWN